MKILRLLSLLIMVVFVAASCGTGTDAKKGDEETKAAEEQVAASDDEGWEILFDGTNTDNFR